MNINLLIANLLKEIEDLKEELKRKPQVIEIETTPVVVDWEHPTARLKVAINILLNHLQIPFTDDNREMLDTVDRVMIACNKFRKYPD